MLKWPFKVYSLVISKVKSISYIYRQKVLSRIWFSVHRIGRCDSFFRNFWLNRWKCEVYHIHTFHATPFQIQTACQIEEWYFCQLTSDYNLFETDYQRSMYNIGRHYGPWNFDIPGSFNNPFLVAWFGKVCLSSVCIELD